MFRAQLLKIASFAHSRRKEEKISIEKLYSELSQIDERMWAKLTKTQTSETGTRRNAAEVIEAKLERLIRKLGEKESKMKSESIVSSSNPSHTPFLEADSVLFRCVYSNVS